MLFSVIIPLYNTERYIKECIDSVLQQTEDDYELLIINDGSDDNSGNIADAYADCDARIKVIHQPNMGAFYTRCNVVEQAKGEYIVYLDADDTLNRNALEVLRKNFEADVDMEMVIFRATTFGDSVKKVNSDILFKNNTIFENESKKNLYKTLLSGFSINPMWIKAYKKDCLKVENLINYPKITMGDDIIQSLYPITNSKKVKYITDILYNYRINNSSMTSTFNSSVYTGFKYVYRDLRDYLKKWGMEDELHIRMYFKRYLYSVSSISFYARNSIKGKKSDYLEMLDDIYNDNLFREAVENSYDQVTILRRIPIYLIKQKQFKFLVLLKAMLTKIRR